MQASKDDLVVCTLDLGGANGDGAGEPRGMVRHSARKEFKGGQQGWRTPQQTRSCMHPQRFAWRCTGTANEDGRKLDEAAWLIGSRLECTQKNRKDRPG
jgi:hypothetical protein